jgi:hypothetical protein
MHTPGRSFDDAHKPLGAELLVETASMDDLDLLADRTKAVAVLRKAEEFLYTHNPGADEPGGVHRALELAAGRTGIEYAEYTRIVRRDPALQELERRVVAAALRP